MGSIGRTPAVEGADCAPLTDTVPMPAAPEFEALMRLAVDVGDVVSLGAAPAGERRVVAITGGRFEGAGGWQGEVLPGGADWQWLRDDGVLEVDARYVLQDAQGARVQVVSQGLRHGPREAIDALMRGVPVDPARYYFRTAMRFETTAPTLAHLNRVMAFAIGAREARRVLLSVFALR
jgi:hypothetical protein